MTIAIVQTGSIGDFNRASLSATSTLGGASSAGSSIITACYHEDYGSAGGSFTVSDGSTYTQNLLNSHSSNVITTLLASRINTAGGTTSVTATCSAGTTANSGGRFVALEVSGLAAYDSTNSVTGFSASSTTPAVGPSGSPLTSPSLILVAFCGLGSFAGAAVPISGFTTLTSDLTGVTGGIGVLAYQIVTSTAALSAALGTLTTATEWCSILGVYAGAGSVAATLPVGSIYT